MTYFNVSLFLNVHDGLKSPRDNLVTFNYKILFAFHWSKCWLPRGLKLGFATVCMLQWRFRIPPDSWKSVSCECCTLSGRFLCDGLIACPVESYRVWCVFMWYRSFNTEEARAHYGRMTHEKIENVGFTYIYHSHIWHRNKLSRCQLELLACCGDDEHQTSLKLDRSSNPITPECRVSHTLRLKHFKIKVAGLFGLFVFCDL